MDTKPFPSFRRIGARAGVFAALAVLAGCYIEERIVWSPDGKQAAVLAGDGLRFCDGEGHLSDVVLSNVTCVTWFKDSKQLAIGAFETCTNWKRISELLEPAAREQVQQASEFLFAKLKDDRAGAALDDAKKKDGNMRSALLLCLLDPNSPTAAETKAALARLAKTGAGTNFSVEIGMIAIAKWSGRNFEMGPRRLGAVGRIASICLSPDDHFLVCAFDQQAAQLWLASLADEAPARKLTDHANLYPDWSPDGKSIVYFEADLSPSATAADSPGDMMPLATLIQGGLLDDSGKLLGKAEKHELAGTFFVDDRTRVRCLRDGRILFDSYKWTLPAAMKDSPDREQLFCVDPLRQSTLTELIPSGAQHDLPKELSCFEVSPDERQVAFGGDGGDVALFTLASGDVTVLQPAAAEAHMNTPSWRPPNQLCFVASEAKGTNQANAEVVLWQPGKTNVLSKAWPAESRRGWLD